MEPWDSATVTSENDEEKPRRLARSSKREEERGWGCGAAERAARLRSAPQAAPYLFGDVAILVDVVEVKGPLEFLMDCPSQQDGETNHKVLWGKGGGDSLGPRFYFQFAVRLPLKCPSV